LTSPTPLKDEEEKLDEWEKGECTTRYMLSQKLPDSAVIRIRKLDTVAKKWELVSNEFMRKGLFVSGRTIFPLSYLPLSYLSHILSRTGLDYDIIHL
jgi:hypothetical protein